jgi:hypothetical protein
MIQHNEPLTVFLSYAPKDKELLEQLKNQLSPLERANFVFLWSDQRVKPGSNREQEIDEQLEKASIILLLISPNYFASDYLYGYEMRRALERHKAGTVCVIPIILHPIEWEQTPLGTLQALPRDGRAVTRWGHRNEAWKQIAAEVRAVVEVLQRSVVVISSLPQQDVTIRLTSLLEAQHVSTIHVAHTLETTEWQETIRQSSAVVLVTSPETRSTHLLEEIRNLASVHQRPVFAVWVVDTDQGEGQNNSPETWEISISLDLASENQEVAFQELIRHLKFLRYRSAFPTGVPPFSEPRNPYKGLRAFTSNDTRDFFGRAALIDELTRSIESMLTLEKLGKQHSRLLAVVGPSGSGKSSVVMAGLLPCLRSGEVFDSNTWIYLNPVVPGERPIDALLIALKPHFPPNTSFKALREDLTDNACSGLRLLATQLVKLPGERVILLIDQFEEIFTLTADEATRQQFFHLLVEAVTVPGSPLFVILTMRVDAYDRLMQYPELYGLIDEHHVSVLPMAQNELRSVIEGPANLPEVQLSFEPGLVEELLFAMQGQSGALPLLEFTLEQLVKRRDGRRLTRQAYREMGEVKGALSQHAEEIYQRLPSDEHRKDAQAIFLRLIHPGLTDQDTTRRRALSTEFEQADPRQTQRMRETLEIFIGARLLTSNQINEQQRIIEVSHEALIREWRSLTEWLRRAREDILFQQSLSEDVTEWEKRQRPGDRLYRGAPTQRCAGLGQPQQAQ